MSCIWSRAARGPASHCIVRALLSSVLLLDDALEDLLSLVELVLLAEDLNKDKRSIHELVVHSRGNCADLINFVLAGAAALRSMEVVRRAKSGCRIRRLYP